MSATQDFLEQNYTRYHSEAFLYSDPLEIVLRFKDPRDQEIVGLFAAMMSYGNVKQIRKSIERWLTLVGEHPYEWIMRDEKERSSIWSQFVHRFNAEKDWIELTNLVSACVQQSGSFGAHLAKIASDQNTGLIGAFDDLMTQWKKTLGPNRMTSSMKHLLSHPSSGGTCKRWMMYFRWMVRKDQLDPGTWSVLFSTSELVMPLDTHTGRWSRKLRLTRRKSVNWKMAQEVTLKLKMFDPVDPIRYDFSLCRVGMFQK